MLSCALFMNQSMLKKELKQYAVDIHINAVIQLHVESIYIAYVTV